MEVRWVITDKDLKRFGAFVERHRNHPLVVERVERNVRRNGIEISKQRFWETLVGCLLTTRQKSGAGSFVEKFLGSGTKLLSFDFCRTHTDLAKYAASEIATAGLPRYAILANQVVHALGQLDAGGWGQLRDALTSIYSHTTVKKERAVARLLQSRFNGIGPKQSRNLIQWLGLSRYEVPLDSRMAKRLLELRFPVPVAAAALSDEDYYCFVEDGLHLLVAKLDIYPCQFDACVFASFEREV
jgi:hypothetical protein